jgi:hypothetical protein
VAGEDGAVISIINHQTKVFGILEWQEIVRGWRQVLGAKK